MLVLTRKEEEIILIGDDIKIMVLGICGSQVRLGITAPREIPIHRAEIIHKIQEEQTIEKL